MADAAGSGALGTAAWWSRPVPTWFALLLIWGLGAAAGWPMLDGPWLFDDGQLQRPIAEMHTQGLAALAGNGWREQLIMSGSPHGRPVSMATFAANALAGTSPFGFKLVNLALHLAVGSLVFLLVRVLGRAALGPAGERGHGEVFALLVALVWVLHPLHVSTYAYVVQRMTILSALPSLLGLWLYARVRVRELGGGAPARTGELIFPLLILPPAAYLAKENGALLPALLLVMESVLFRWQGSVRTRRVLAVYYSLVVLTGLVLAAVLFTPERLRVDYAGRDFTAGERLLTQARVVSLYVGQVLLPRPDWMTFYYDRLPVSHGFWQPVTTLPAIAFLAGLFGLGLALVRRRPLAAFGILFFFAGHLMESTLIPLVLAFEHRSYLPSLGLILAAADLLAGARGDLARWRAPIVGLVLLGLFALTVLRASAWGGTGEGIWLTALAADPPSDTARAEYAQWLTEQGRTGEARGLVAGAYGLGPRLHEGYLDCLETGRLPPERLTQALAQTDAFPESYEASAVMIIGRLAVEGACKVPRVEFLGLLETVAADKRYGADRRGAFRQHQAALLHAGGESAAAQAALEVAFVLDPVNPGPLLTAAEWSLDAGDPTAARAFYERARAVRLRPSMDLDERLAVIASRLDVAR